MTTLTVTGTTPKRLQMSRQRPWRADNPDAVIVARPSKWGNPLRWDAYPTHPPFGRLAPAFFEGGEPQALSDAMRRYWAVMEFRAGLLYGPDVVPLLGYPSVEDVQAELAGRDLACWCPLSHPCHADVLLAVANGWAAVPIKPAPEARCA